MNIVSDGKKRLAEATKEKRAARKIEIRLEISGHYKKEYQAAGFLKRMWLNYKSDAELRKRIEAEFPTMTALHF